MPPRIETVADLFTETQVVEEKYFVIHLQEEVEAFNLDLFHSQAKEAGAILAKYTGRAIVKYVVVADRMLIFANLINHADFYDSLKRSGDSGELQSAGDIEIDFALSRPGLKSGRRISNYSLTLEETNQLPREKSDEYKRTTIKRVLGEFFQIY